MGQKVPIFPNVSKSTNNSSFRPSLLINNEQIEPYLNSVFVNK
jgi:hypothetical protein